MKSFRIFDLRFACMYGADSAVLISAIEEWMDYSQINGTGFFVDGSYWITVSKSMINETLMYLSHEEIEDVIQDCIDNSLLIIKVQSSKKEAYITFGSAMSQFTSIHKRATQAKVSFDRYSGNRNLVLSRDKSKCSICGCRKNIVVHHIDGYDPFKPKNNAANKLIVLCRSCHARVHAKSEESHINIPREQLERIGYFDEE